MPARTSNLKLDRATLTDFHGVKLELVVEDANNTSTSTSLLGGFTVVIIAMMFIRLFVRLSVWDGHLFIYLFIMKIIQKYTMKLR